HGTVELAVVGARFGRSDVGRPGMILKPVFNMMAAKKATDLYVVAGAPIHIGVEGNVVPINQQKMTPEVIQKMASELMSPQQSKIYEETLELNMSLVIPEIGNFRINLYRQRGSIALVARFISFDIPNLKDLNLPLFLNDLMMEKRGLILVVGPTGSGKSSTLAAMLSHRIATKTGHVLTLEDPVEFMFRHDKSIVSQRDIGLDSLSYPNALKSALRQAPDCMLIGEIREAQTMTMATNFSLSGHLCLATLHANNTYHVLNRIIQMYPLENRNTLLQDLSVSLKAVIALRLVMGKDGKRLPAFELLVNTQRIADLIERGAVSEIKEAMAQSLSPSLMTFDQSLLKLFRAGKITWDTALANAESPTNMSLQVNSTEVNSARAVAAAAPKLGEVSFDFNLPSAE
ncbi:MAG: PilT/PilU family type 4a pilus ATPase, partial [Pseudomonadota bacterium]|nr:PilT/PilU family type 4a pilus ATPase [Pseudomonadota bacterium]